MQRGKSAGATPYTTSADEIRTACRRISPYIVHCWHEVCEELGVADADIEKLEHAQAAGSRLSDVAFRGLNCWHDMVGKSANKDRLLRVLQLCGLRRAEDELRSLNKGRHVPFMGRPATAVPLQDGGTNRQARQKALANRLSRPKKVTKEDQTQSTALKKQATVVASPGTNPLTRQQISPSKESDICEVKIRINVRGVKRTDEGEMESTKDDINAIKDDFKHTCHTFLNLVMKHQQAHFKTLKELLGFSGISVLRLSKMGFNINVFILCFNLGAFEVLYQSYSSGRLKNIVQGALVTEEYLRKLNTKHLELSVLIEDGMVNKYRDILVVRSDSAPTDVHPVDLIDVPDSDENEKQTSGNDSPPISLADFNLKYWRQELYADIEVLQERYDTFMEKSNELLIILRIAKPPGSHVLENMREVVDIFQKLRSSKSVSTESRIDFIEEYLTIVNQIRLKTDYIHKHDLQISFDETLAAEACDKFHSELTKLAEMLEPDFRFKVEERFIANSLSANEKITYGGMFSHIPRLLHKLHAICDILSQTVDVSEVSSETVAVVTDETEVTVDENANITDKHAKSVEDTQEVNTEQPIE